MERGHPAAEHVEEAHAHVLPVLHGQFDDGLLPHGVWIRGELVGTVQFNRHRNDSGGFCLSLSSPALSLLRTNMYETELV